MKKTLKFLSSVFLISLIGLVNCHKYETGGSPSNGYLVGQYINGLIQSATTGNCAISVNLGSLYAGAIVQGAAASSTAFPQAAYEAVTGSTITAQGYASYATVPFNKKYDAFLTNSSDGTTWTNATRGAVVAATKVSTDLGALVGGVAAYCAANLASTPALAASGATTSGTLQAVATSVYGTFNTAEQAGIDAAINASFSTPTGGLVTSWASYVASAIPTVGLANGSGASCLSVATGGTTSLNVVINGVAGQAGGLTNIISAYMARTAYKSGAALMACARIPKSNCSVEALITNNRDSDVASVVGSYNMINQFSECRKPGNSLLHTVLTQGLVGLPKEKAVNMGNKITIYNTSDIGGSEGSSSSFTGSKILAEKAYPKSGALIGIAASFVSAHPMKSGATAYPTATDGTVATPFYGGSNINVANVTSCEGLGLGEFGPTPVQSTDDLATYNSKKKLTDVKEIIYAFSAANTAASAYSAAISVVSAGTATNDAIACNRQMRKITAIPAALGVGTTLTAIDTTSGDGGATSLVTACVYGGDSTSRTTISGILQTTLPGLTACPAAAATGATSFGATGLTTYTSFPDGQ